MAPEIKGEDWDGNISVGDISNTDGAVVVY